MKKHEAVFLFIFMITAFFIVRVQKEQIKQMKLEDFEVTMEIENVCPHYFYTITVLYPDSISFNTSLLEIDKISKTFGLEFNTDIQDYLYDYEVHTIKSPFPNYRNYQPVFYNIPVANHKIIPDFIDEEHKIAIVYQKYNMYHFNKKEEEIEEEDFVEINTDKMLVCDGTEIRPATKEDDIPIYREGKHFFNIERQTWSESRVRKENQYFQDLIKQADVSMKVKKPFQNRDTYTVIYLERGFFQKLYYNDEQEKGALTPYLEKAFESLGYTKIDEKND